MHEQIHVFILLSVQNTVFSCKFFRRAAHRPARHWPQTSTALPRWDSRCARRCARSSVMLKWLLVARLTLASGAGLAVSLGLFCGLFPDASAPTVTGSPCFKSGTPRPLLDLSCGVTSRTCLSAPLHFLVYGLAEDHGGSERS